MTTRHAHANRIVESIPITQRAAIAAHPISGIQGLGYQVAAEPTLTSQRGAGGMCDGLSFAEHNTVIYAPTAGSKRENFTLLHEAAHILVERDDDALVYIADCDDPDVEMERLCDEVAAALVVPDVVIDDLVGSGPITADDLRNLTRDSAASGPACAIALSSRLHAAGAVVIVDRSTQRVLHASLRGDLTVYPWKETDVPTDHPLRRLQPGDMYTGKSYWSNGWGQRQTYYLSAVATEKRVYAVFSTIDLWGVDKFHGGQADPERSAAPHTPLACRCGYRGPGRGWPCPTCNKQFCPSCDDCDCTRRDARQDLCSSCFCVAPPVDLVDGMCSNCR